MIFALIDLYNYKRLKGRYGDLAVGTFMSIGHRDKIPSDIVEMLQPGDAIFTQRLDSLVSWAILYFSSSEIDHAAVYVGNREVLHMTLKGSRKHSIDALTKGTRALPVRFAPSDTEVPFDPPPDATSEFYTPKFPISKLAPKWQFAWGGLRTVAGFHPERFRLKFLADLFVIAALLDLFLIGIGGTPVAIFAAIAIFATCLINIVRFKVRRRRGGLIRYLSHPDLGYRSFSRMGGLIFSNLGPLVVVEFGILPVGAFLALSREGSDDSTPDELQQFRQSARDIAKRWGFIPDVEQSEDKYRNQDDDKEVEEGPYGPRHTNE